MIMEQMLINYGVLGLWVIMLLKQQYDYNKSFKQLIENNTNALIRNNIYLENNKKKEGGV
jgi:hypothetical protein